MATATAPKPAADSQVQNWPYQFEILSASKMFVDESYQRPLTNFVDKIKAKWDPALVGTLVVAKRREPIVGEDGKKRMYAVVDGQTRMVSIEELFDEKKIHHDTAPCLVYTGLSLADEASLFARLQKERRGIASYHRFRASVVAGEPEANAIQRMAESIGFEIGVGPSQLSAVAGLEKVYRRAPGELEKGELLERTLLILNDAWTKRGYTPKGDVIRGLGRFLEEHDGVDDDRLSQRLSTKTPDELARRASALREGMGHGGSSDKYMAAAFEGIYRSARR